MKTNAFQQWPIVVLSVIFTGIFFAGPLCAASLTDYGAVPAIAQPPQDQLDANQKLDFHTDLFTGRFGYEIPVAVPPARGGSAPSVALQYNSASKNGWCGVGWDLDGGYIQRETRYGVPVSGSSYADSFGFTFSFGGHSGRLVGIGGGVYYPQINTDFLKFLYTNGTWTVTDKSGRKFRFGETTAARITTSFGTYRWGLSSTLDPNGNQSLYSYTSDSGQLYLNQIAYNGNTNSPSIATNCAVVFDLSSRSDVISSAISGAEIKTAKLLTGIRVFNQGQLVRRYALAYSTSPSTGRALLQTAIQYGADNTTALPTQTFGYTVQSQSFSTPVLWSIVSQTTTGDSYGITPGTPDAQLVDINGDGLPDRVVHPYGTAYFLVQYNTGNGFTGQYYWSPVGNVASDPASAWNNLDSLDSHLIDINGDGLPDRVMNEYTPSYTYFQVQLNTGSGFSSSIYGWNNVASILPNVNNFSTNLLNQPYAEESSGYGSLSTLADLNGDGLPDRVTVGSANGQFDVQYNTGGGFSTSIYAWNNVYPSGYSSDVYYAPRARNNAAVYSDLVDMNGDGLPDRILNNGAGNAGVQVNNGAGSFGSLQSWNMSSTFYPGYIDVANGANNGMLVDMNGDGLPDLVYMSSPYTSGAWLVYINNGIGFTGPVTWNNIYTDILGSTGSAAPQAWDANGTRAEMIDMNGDGLPDRVLRYPNTAGSPTDYLEVQYNSGPFPDLLNVVNNGIGGSVSVTYQSSTSYLNPDGTRPRMPFPVQVVTAMTVNDGRGNSGTTSYAYNGAYYDRTYREFRGFYSVSETGPLGAYTVTAFHQGGGNSVNGSANGEYQDDVAKSGMPFQVDEYGNDNKLYRVTLNKVNEVLFHTNSSSFYSSYFPFVQQTVKLDYEGNSNARSTATGYAYSPTNGNLLSVTNWSEVTNVNFSAHTFTAGLAGAPPPVYQQYTYAPIAGNADIIGQPASVTVSADAGGTTVLQQTLYQYFSGTGNLQQKSELVCPGTYAVTTYTDDSYGNVATITDPVSIVTKINYDTTATFPVAKSTGALTNYTQFDPRSGSLLAATNEQGLVTANAYDVFFRLTNSATSTTPNGVANLWRKRLQYTLGGITSNNSSNLVRLLQNDPADAVNGSHETDTYLDGLGRAIQTRDEAETNGYRVSDLVYDAGGNVILQEYPFFQSGAGYAKPSGTRTNVYTQFDPIGRPFKVNPCASASFNSSGWLSGTPTALTGDTGSPVGPTSIDYNDGGNPWAIVVTNALGKIHKYYTDAYGRTNRIVEVTAGGNFTTTLKYDLMGDLTNLTDNASNQTSFSTMI